MGTLNIWVGKKPAGNPDILLRGLHTDSLSGTHPGLQGWYSDLEGVRDTEKETELWGFTVRTGGTVAIFPC